MRHYDTDLLPNSTPRYIQALGMTTDEQVDELFIQAVEIQL
ncbi:MAG: hypothetical protein ACOX0Y_00835 [Thiopseudomonas sp.]